MGQELQKKAIDSIDSFNSAIAATRMYPAMTPQVENAVSHALKSIVEFIDEVGSLHVGLNSNDIQVMGEVLDDNDKQAIEKYVIFKQLKLLQLQHLVFVDGLTSELLRKIIFVFTARKEKIAREGGGRKFVDQLGLSENFPEAYVKTGVNKKSSGKERQWERLSPELEAVTISLVESLNSDEALINLPPEIEKLIVEGQFEPVSIILQQISEKLEKADPAGKVRLTRTLCLVGEILLKNGQTRLLVEVASPMKSWLEESDNVDFVYEKFAEILQAVSNYYLKTEKLEVSKKIITLFKDIRSGVRPKSPPVKAILKRVQERAVDTEAFDVLMEEYSSNPENLEQGQLILAHGSCGFKYLLDLLINTENREERMQVINLLKLADEEILTVIFRYLDKPLPWYGKRNLLILLAEFGDESCADKLITFLNHEDLRVQNEALNCIQKISGSRLKEVLLMSLPVAADPIKVQMIHVLTPVSDERVASVLIEILDRQNTLSEEHRESIVIQASKALAGSNSLEALRWLKTFLSEMKKAQNYSQDVFVAVEQAVLTLGMVFKDVEFDEDNFEKTQPVHSDSSVPASNDENLVAESITSTPEENEIRRLFQAGETDKAVGLLVKLIMACAKNKRFNHANKLRELLMSSSPMSLTEIIQTAEVIEEEMALSINQSNIEVWNDLFEVLTSDEFSTLYHSMQHKKYRRNESIVKQHSLLSAMFFINSGTVKLFYTDKKGANVLVKVVGPGQIVGVDAFFDASVWTVSVVADSDVDLSILEIESLQQWREEYPALESKLNDFCLGFESLEQFFKRTTQDRRQDKRYDIHGRVSTVLLDNHGNPTKVSSKGDFADISCGGVSYLIRISMKENARVLLGQPIRVFLPAGKTLGQYINADGSIVAVKAHLAMESEYSVHVKFNKKLSLSEVKTIIRSSKDS